MAGALLREYPTRFVLGGDEFIVAPNDHRAGPALTASRMAPMARLKTCTFLGTLPADLAKKIAVENVAEIYRLKP